MAPEIFSISVLKHKPTVIKMDSARIFQNAEAPCAKFIDGKTEEVGGSSVSHSPLPGMARQPSGGYLQGLV